MQTILSSGQRTVTMRQLALRQVAPGAEVLDVNVGLPGTDEVALLCEVVRVLLDTVEMPLCLDSASPAALAAALAIAAGKPLVNSVHGTRESLSAVLPIVNDRGAAVIGLTIADQGIPETPQARLAIAARIVDCATRIGIPCEDVITRRSFVPTPRPIARLPCPVDPRTE